MPDTDEATLREEQLEDDEAARLVAAFQAGTREAFTGLYRCYFDRVYAYMKVALNSAQDADDAAQQVFLEVLEALPRYELRTEPFRAWLFAIARNYTFRQLRRKQIDPMDPGEIERHGEVEEPIEHDLFALRWVTDLDLLTFIERLPLAQRQAVVLRHMMGFSNAEIATILSRSPDAIKMLQHRAVAYLRKRLIAIGREPKHQPLSGTRTLPSAPPVTRARRYSLTSPGPTR